MFDLKFVFLVSFESFDTAILFLFGRVIQSGGFGGEIGLRISVHTIA